MSEGYATNQGVSFGGGGGSISSGFVQAVPRQSAVPAASDRIASNHDVLSDLVASLEGRLYSVLRPEMETKGQELADEFPRPVAPLTADLEKHAACIDNIRARVASLIDRLEL